MKTKIIITALSISALALPLLPGRSQNSVPEVRFYYAITTRGAYELAGFSNVGDFSRWFHASQWTTNENLFVIATKERVSDIEVPFYTEATGHALKKVQRQILDSFTAANYIIPKVHPDPIAAINDLVSHRTEVFISTNDLLPEQVHVIGPDGKVYLSVHSDSFDKLKQPRAPSRPAPPLRIQPLDP